MDSHITFEELQEFVFAKAVSPDIIQLGSRINAHVLSCEECAEQYNAMLKMREMEESILRDKIEAALLSETKADIDKQVERDLIDQQIAESSTPGKEGLKKDHQVQHGSEMTPN